MSILIKNIHSLVTMDDKFTVMHDVDLRIESNKIAEIGKNIDIKKTW